MDVSSIGRLVIAEITEPVDLSFTLNVLHEKDMGFKESNGWAGGAYPFRI